ncbi:hypothetical protein BAY59_10895 [Prauserella coralliicola]|nr:hypothetical protein BAY59_10895 [Prauserella coralliicola]
MTISPAEFMASEPCCVHDIYLSQCPLCTPEAPARREPLVAQYETTCIPCGGEIVPGDEITQHDDGYYVHAECADSRDNENTGDGSGGFF